jgi:ATP-binding cassette, subfamily B, bacterial PglK
MHRHTSKFLRANSLYEAFQAFPKIMIETTLILLVISYVAICNVFLSKSLDISSLSIFALASMRILPAASQIATTYSGLLNSRHSVDVLYHELREARHQERRPNKLFQQEEGLPIRKDNTFSHSPLSYSKNPKSSTDFSFFNDIQIHHISYSYAGSSSHSINNLSLSLQRGESIAFIGKSGAGKTTLVDIILGLLIPQQGDIQIDGKSIYENLRGWQNLLGYIPQSIFLMDDTIARNIAYGVPDSQIDNTQLSKVIKAAQLDNLISQLPDGIHTKIGERGIRLSGGQRQRIGIARALYHDREILVLDEATSALDNETESEVSEAIQALSGKKTLIIIAHRLSTIRYCDKVYMLKEGQIVKSGSYDDVIEFNR